MNPGLRLPVPVNKFPEFVGHLVQRLHTLCPTLGKKKIAQIQILARAGLHLGTTTVGRMLKQSPPSFTGDGRGEGPLSPSPSMGEGRGEGERASKPPGSAV